MVTSPYKWRIIVWDENPQTNKIILRRDVSLVDPLRCVLSSRDYAMNSGAFQV